VEVREKEREENPIRSYIHDDTDGDVGNVDNDAVKVATPATISREDVGGDSEGADVNADDTCF
jgi:hypothetical protein